MPKRPQKSISRRKRASDTLIRFLHRHTLATSSGLLRIKVASLQFLSTLSLETRLQLFETFEADPTEVSLCFNALCRKDKDRLLKDPVNLKVLLYLIDGCGYALGKIHRSLSKVSKRLLEQSESFQRTLIETSSSEYLIFFRNLAFIDRNRLCRNQSIRVHFHNKFNSREHATLLSLLDENAMRFLFFRDIWLTSIDRAQHAGTPASPYTIDGFVAREDYLEAHLPVIPESWHVQAIEAHLQVHMNRHEFIQDKFVCCLIDERLSQNTIAQLFQSQLFLSALKNYLSDSLMPSVTYKNFWKIYDALPKAVRPDFLKLKPVEDYTVTWLIGNAFVDNNAKRRLLYEVRQLPEEFQYWFKTHRRHTWNIGRIDETLHGRYRPLRVRVASQRPYRFFNERPPVRDSSASPVHQLRR